MEPTSLGELELPEYIFGLFKVYYAATTPEAYKEHILTHTMTVAEDAINYPWTDVRPWSEALIANITAPQSPLLWSNKVDIRILRSEKAKKGAWLDPKANTARYPSDPHDAREATPHGGTNAAPRAGSKGDVCDMPREVKLAQPSKPCQDFNKGECPHPTHHVDGEYRRLHLCSNCLPSYCKAHRHAAKGCFGLKRSKNSKRPASLQ